MTIIGILILGAGILIMYSGYLGTGGVFDPLKHAVGG